MGIWFETAEEEAAFEVELAEAAEGERIALEEALEAEEAEAWERAR